MSGIATGAGLVAYFFLYGTVSSVGCPVITSSGTREIAPKIGHRGLVAPAAILSILLHASGRRHGNIERWPESRDSAQPDPIAPRDQPDPLLRPRSSCSARTVSRIVGRQEQVPGVREETPADAAEKMGSL